MKDSNFKTRLKNIKAIVLDVDGVLTDGSLILSEKGAPLRKMNSKDGFAMKFAHDKGIKIAIITGGTSKWVEIRLNNLGIKDVFLGAYHKMSVFDEYLKNHGLNAQQVLYMGDDVPDLEVMKKVGIASCPNDAVPEIKNISDYVSLQPGGQGCVRDVIEQVLKVQGHWNF